MSEEEKKFAKVGALKEGSYVLVDGNACQIKGIEKSKPGRHGSAKARISAFDIFTGQKRTLLKPTAADAEVPIIKRSVAQVVAVMGDNVQIMDVQTYETMSVAKPDVTGLSSGTEVEYIRYGENVKILSKK